MNTFTQIFAYAFPVFLFGYLFEASGKYFASQES